MEPGKKTFSIALLFLLTYKLIQKLTTNICHGLDFGGQAAVLVGKPFEGVRGKSRTSDVIFLIFKSFHLNDLMFHLWKCGSATGCSQRSLYGYCFKHNVLFANDTF